MRKLLKLVKSNIRTSKASIICVGVLLLVAALLLNISLILSTDYKKNYYDKHDYYNAEHVTVAVTSTQDDLKPYVEKMANEDENITSYEMIPMAFAAISIPFNGANYATSSAFISYRDMNSKTIGKYEMVEELKGEEGIYLPSLFKYNGYKLGDIANFTLNEEQSFSYKVVGFASSLMTGSNNCSLTTFVLSDSLYDEVCASSKPEYIGYLCSFRISDNARPSSYEAVIANNIKSNTAYINYCSNNLEIVASARYIITSLSTVIILFISIMIIVIALVISGSNLSEYIKENMKKIGSLKAIGYTSKDLILSFILEFGITALLSSLLGVALSYVLFPLLNNLFISQTGIPYAIKFLSVPALITVVALVLIIVLVILLSCIRVRKIEAIDALREGVKTHSFKKNLLPLDKKNVGLNLKMGLKSGLSNTRGTITSIITSFVLMFVLIFDVFMLFNAVISFNPMLKLICAIVPDGVVYADATTEEAIVKDFKNDDNISKYYLLSSSDVAINDDSIWCQMTYNGKDVEGDLIVEGSAPVLSNEIAIGMLYAMENNIVIGQTIKVSHEAKEEEYIVSGFTQNSNYLGKDCLLTIDGYLRIGNGYNITYNIELKDRSKLTETLKYYETTYNCMTIDYLEESQAFTKVYKSLIQMVFIAILVITALVVTFVLFLLVRSMLNKKKKEFGIYKALGFQTKDLILQMIISFLPGLLIGTILGLVSGYFSINPLFGLLLRNLGLFKCNLAIPFYGCVIAGLLLISFSLVIVGLLSIRIKKMNPYNLLIGE